VYTRLVLILLFILIVVMGCSTGDRTPSTEIQTRRWWPQAGNTARLKEGGMIPVAVSQEAFKSLQQFQHAHDDYGVRELFAAGWASLSRAGPGS